MRTERQTWRNCWLLFFAILRKHLKLLGFSVQSSYIHVHKSRCLIFHRIYFYASNSESYITTIVHVATANNKALTYTEKCHVSRPSGISLHVSSWMFLSQFPGTDQSILHRVGINETGHSAQSIMDDAVLCTSMWRVGNNCKGQNSLHPFTVFIWGPFASPFTHQLHEAEFFLRS